MSDPSELTIPYFRQTISDILVVPVCGSMPKDKTLLLEEINTIIRENFSNLNTQPEQNAVLLEGGAPGLSQKPGSLREYMPLSKILQTIARLEQRIDALEKQNDNLLYFIHFIYENFSSPASSSLTSLSAVNRPKRHSLRGEKEAGTGTPELTPREMEVLDFLVKGLCVKEIATKLFISQNTVITHKKNIREKFKARSTVELISKAFQLTHESEDT